MSLVVNSRGIYRHDGNCSAAAVLLWKVYDVIIHMVM